MSKFTRKHTLGVLIISVFATVSLTVPMLFRPVPRILWNASASIPTGLYFVEQRPPKIGEIAVIRPAEWVLLYTVSRGYLPRNVWLLKPIVAAHGSVVCRFGKFVFVDGRPVAKAKTFDQKRLSLPVWKGCRVLNFDEVFVLARPQDSFDSRYFGPVKCKQIVGTAIPVTAPSK
jgi:conjugative transfer signal peptidase TraF